MCVVCLPPEHSHLLVQNEEDEPLQYIKDVSGENASLLDMAGYITFVRVPQVRILAHIFFKYIQNISNAGATYLIEVLRTQHSQFLGTANPRLQLRLGVVISDRAILNISTRLHILCDF